MPQLTLRSGDRPPADCRQHTLWAGGSSSVGIAVAVSVPLYAGAASVGSERVHSGDHWLTAGLVGAAIGELTGRSVAGAPSATASGPGATDGSVRYRPVVSMRSVGVAVQF